MPDNVDLPATGVKAAADEVDYSGNTAKVQLMREVHVEGAEGARTVTEITLPEGKKVVLIDPNTGDPLLVDEDGTLSVRLPGNVPVYGSISHDDVDAHAPVKIGGYAKATAPTDVSADGDIANAWLLRNGAQVVAPQIGGTLLAAGAGTATAAQRSTLASDDPAVTALQIMDDWDESDRAKVNPIAGQAGVAAGAGAVSALTQRATLASDDPAVASLGVIDDWDESDRAKVNVIVGQAGVTAGAGAVAANTPRATLASDDPAVASLGVMDDWDESDRAKVNPIAGQAGVAGGSGTVSALTQRVVLATDVALPTGSNAIGKLSANSGVDVGDVDVTTLPSVSTATLSNVADQATTIQLLAANAARKGCVIWNDSTEDLFIKYGTTAALTDATYKIPADAQWTMVAPFYTGRIDGIWRNNASGSARITEL